MDAAGDSVRMQHVLGVAATVEDGKHAVYIADSYNNKIKRLDLAAKTVATVYGSGEPSDLWEPGGLSIWHAPDGARLYIADTNNHRILQSAISAEGNLQPPVPVRLAFAPGVAGSAAGSE